MKYFTIDELTHTDTGLENIPNEEQVSNLNALVDNVLDPVRELLGSPIKVNSGFRCLAVNKAVKGSKTSGHPKGEASDITCYDNAKLFNLIKDNLVFDQLIWEKGNNIAPEWVHVSYCKINRNEILKYNGQYYIKIDNKSKT